jgi:hypothetical protein
MYNLKDREIEQVEELCFENYVQMNYFNINRLQHKKVLKDNRRL